MHCLLIDVGSTFIKYSVYDTIQQSECVSNAVAFPAPSYQNEKVFHVSAFEIERKILDIFSKVSHHHCKKAFFSVQMHGYLLRDKDGAFSPYVSWRDRTANICDPRVTSINFEPYGTSLKENLPLAKIAFHGIDGEFFTLGSYIAWVLTGNNATHLTDACASGFYQVDTGKVNEYAKGICMPKASCQIQPVGMYGDIEIYSPIGDHQISYLGSGAERNAYLVNIGTATQISCEDAATFPSDTCEKRPYFNGSRLHTLSGLVGGDLLYKGDGKDQLLTQLLKAVKVLPQRQEILFGGGGAPQVFDDLSRKLMNCGFRCRLLRKNIGMDGLKMIVEQYANRMGTMLSEISFSNFPIIAQNTGLDFVIVDEEHGYFGYAEIAKLVTTANLIDFDLIVRVGNSSRGHLTKLADMGVRAFLLPMTGGRADIEQVIECVKYPPHGKRGVSTTRAHTLYNPPPLAEYMKTANERMAIFAQIETAQGVENAEDIVSLEHVSGLFVGPNDLSVDLGCVNEREHLFDGILKVSKAAARAKKPWGIITGDKELIDFSRQHGASMFSIGSELNMLINGCKNIKGIF